MLHLAALLFLASLPPAAAQDLPAPNLASSGSGSPSGVARLVLAYQLYAIGTAYKDPLTVLNAARLAGSVTLTDTARAHETSGTPSPIAAPNPTTAAEMLASATTLAAENEALLDLIEAARRDGPFSPQANIVSTKSHIAGAGTDSWALPFFGASPAELAILGDGASNLDLRIADENGTPVCQDVGPSDTAYCSFYPARNGMFQITVINTGNGANSYLLLTN